MLSQKQAQDVDVDVWVVGLQQGKVLLADLECVAKKLVRGVLHDLDLRGDSCLSIVEFQN